MVNVMLIQFFDKPCIDYIITPKNSEKGVSFPLVEKVSVLQ